MQPHSFYSVKWFLLAAVLAGTGFVTLVAPPRVRQPHLGNMPPLDGSPLVGFWNQQGGASRYQVNITPSVLFITSYDEADICEIEIVGHDVHSGGGVLRGVIRLHRVGYDNLPLLGRQVTVYYELRDEVLKLSWDEWLELSPLFTHDQLIAERGLKKYAVDPTR